MKPEKGRAMESAMELVGYVWWILWMVATLAALILNILAVRRRDASFQKKPAVAAIVVSVMNLTMLLFFVGFVIKGRNDIRNWAQDQWEHVNTQATQPALPAAQPKGESESP